MSDENLAQLATFFSTVADTLTEARQHPHGPPGSAEARQVAGRACVKLCGGDQNKGRTLWKIIADELGYMPQAALVALVHASETVNLVPDVEAPDLT